MKEKLPRTVDVRTAQATTSNATEARINEELERKRKRAPLSSTFASLCTILREPELRRKILGDGKLEFDLLETCPVIGRRRIDETVLAGIRERCELVFEGSNGKGLRFNPTDVREAVCLVASDHKFHPVDEYLRSLRWDGTKRIHRIAGEILHVSGDADELASILLRKFFLSAAARATREPTKVDSVLVLVGPQGSQKSGFLRELAGAQWFSDTPIDVESKDSLQAMSRHWIIEWPEINAHTLGRREDQVKGFLTSQTDSFRPPYGKHIQVFHRRSIIVATTNRAEFLTDLTGNRRWWPVQVRDGAKVDLELLRSWRDQLWAEAMTALKEDEPWHLSTDDESKLEALHESHVAKDPWEEPVSDFMRRQAFGVTAERILRDALHMPSGTMKRGDVMRLTNILRKWGLRGKQARTSKAERATLWGPLTANNRP